MLVTEGKYFVRECKEDGFDEKYIMLILPKNQWNAETVFRTETLAVHNMDLWQNDWHLDFIDREATEEEITLIKSERSKYEELMGLGEKLVGKKLSTVDESLKTTSQLGSD